MLRIHFIQFILKSGSLGKLYSTGEVNFRSIFSLAVTGGYCIRLSVGTFVFSSTITDWWLAGPFTNSHRDRETQPCTIRLCTQHLAHYCTHTAVSQTDCPNGQNVNRRSCQVTCRVVTARVLFASSVALRLEQRREKSTTLRLFHLIDQQIHSTSDFIAYIYLLIAILYIFLNKRQLESLERENKIVIKVDE